MPYKVKANICQQCGQSYQTSPSNPHSHYCSDKCRGLARRGENHPLYKGGCIHIRNGYRCISVDGKGYMEHRYVMEQHIGRSLLRSEHVHHIDGNRSNNALENLELIPASEHYKVHLKTFRSETHKQCSKCHVIKPRSQFCVRSDRVDPHMSSCKECEALARATKKNATTITSPQG